MNRNFRMIAIVTAAAFALIAPGLIASKAYADSGPWMYAHGARVIHPSTTTSAQVVVHDDDVAPVLAVLVGGLVLASAIHASEHCDQVVVAAPACPPRYDYGYGDDRGEWHRDNGWHNGHGRGHGRGHGCGHDRGWERDDD